MSVEAQPAYTQPASRKQPQSTKLSWVRQDSTEQEGPSQEEPREKELYAEGRAGSAAPGLAKGPQPAQGLLTSATCPGLGLLPSDLGALASPCSVLPMAHDAARLSARGNMELSHWATASFPPFLSCLFLTLLPPPPPPPLPFLSFSSSPHPPLSISSPPFSLPPPSCAPIHLHLQFLQSQC